MIYAKWFLVFVAVLSMWLMCYRNADACTATGIFGGLLIVLTLPNGAKS